MAQLIYDWLNEEVKLSRRINSLSDDFRDGYLIGELLARYNQQSNFHQFSAKGNPDAKINNFCLIEPTMRQVGVPFNSKIASDIMNAKEGAVKNLLYELKTALETISRNSRQSTNGSYGTDTILCVIAPSRPLYDKTMAITFENAIRAMIENPNEVMMESVTRRFREKKSDFRQSVSAGHTGMMDSIQQDLMRSKEIERHRKAHEGEFAEAWENINIDQWKTNQRVARERKDLKKRVELGQSIRKENQIIAGTARTREHTINSINEFDNRLEDAILASSSTAAKGGSGGSLTASALIKTIKQLPGSTTAGPELVYIDQDVLREGLVGAQKKMKEHHEDGAVRQQANDRRRRRFIREFDTQQTRLSQSFFEKDLTTQLLNNSQSEVIENSALNRASSYKQIMTENRENRSQLMLRKAETDRERNVEWRALEARRELDWVVQADIDSQLARRQSLLDATSSASRTQNDDIARNIVEKILDVAEWVISCRTMGVYHYRSSGGSEHAAEMDDQSATTVPVGVVPDEIWRDAAAMFTSSLSVAHALPSPKPLRVTLSLKPFSIVDRPLCSDAQWLFKRPFDSVSVMGTGEDGAQMTQHLSSEETRQYIADLNVLDVDAESDVIPVNDQEQQEEEDLTVGLDLMLAPPWLLPINTAPNYFLGETIIAIRCAVDPVPDEPAPVVASEHIPLRAAICGLSDLARRRLAEELRNKVPGLVVIGTEALVLQAWNDKLAGIETTTTAVSSDVNAEKPDLEMNSTLAALSAQASDGEEVVLRADEKEEPPVLSSVVEVVDEEEAEAAREAARALAEEYANLCDSVHACLSSGSAISDELYVALIVCAIKRVPAINNGFVVQDFPNTKTQALLLMEALSGTRYDIKKPQAADKTSDYAPHRPCEEILYDIKKCGLDVIVYVESAISDEACALNAALDERVRVRKNLFTGGIEYLTDNCPSVIGLQEVFDSSRPIQTSGIDLTVAERTNADLRELFSRFQILDVLQTAHFSTLDEAVQSKAAQLCERFIPPGNLHPNYLLGIVDPPEQEVEEMDDEEEALLVTGDETARPFSAEESLALESFGNEQDATVEIETTVTRPRSPALRVINAIPLALAVSLSNMWSLSEQQSQFKSKQYFTAFRDVRYQFVQRRRSATDCLNYMLVRLDQRQEIFDAFRLAFNDVHSDMRFDPDCAAELHLQTLELGDAIFRESEARKKAAQEYVRQVGADAVLSLAIHRCYSESAALVQAEYNRFYVALHLLFDYTKSVKGFEMQSRVLNELELTLPLVVPSAEASTAVAKNGKEPKKEVPKKGKDVGKPVPVPFREPVPAVLLPSASLLKLPEAKPLVDVVVDPKAKKPKEKKGAVDDSAVSNPFEEIETLVLDDISTKWSRTVFVVNRDVYENDEMVCSALEKAIWFEAEKLLKSVYLIRANLTSQVLWLEHSESNLMAQLNDTIISRFHKELSAAKLLLSLATLAIESADPMEELWLVAPDAMPPVNPTTMWRRFYDHLPEHNHQSRITQPYSSLGHDKHQSGSKTGFIPEHTSYAIEQANARSSAPVRPGSAPSDDSAIRSQEQAQESSRPASNTTGGGRSTARKPSSAGHPPSATQDDSFKRKQEKYQADRKEFEAALQRRRRDREEDFLEMGMAPGNAKLAAFNELLLEEQQQMEDFEARNKPRPASAAATQRSKPTRYGNLMNVARQRRGSKG